MKPFNSKTKVDVVRSRNLIWMVGPVETKPAGISELIKMSPGCTEQIQSVQTSGQASPAPSSRRGPLLRSPDSRVTCWATALCPGAAQHNLWTEITDQGEKERKYYVSGGLADTGPVAHTLLMQTLAKKYGAMHRGGSCSRGSRGSVQSLCGHKDGAGARTDGGEGEPLCPAPAPRILHLVSPHNLVQGSPDGLGDLLNICNGRQKKGRKVSLVTATPVNGDQSQGNRDSDDASCV